MYCLLWPKFTKQENQRDNGYGRFILHSIYKLILLYFRHYATNEFCTQPNNLPPVQLPNLLGSGAKTLKITKTLSTALVGSDNWVLPSHFNHIPQAFCFYKVSWMNIYWFVLKMCDCISFIKGIFYIYIFMNPFYKNFCFIFLISFYIIKYRKCIFRISFTI